MVAGVTGLVADAVSAGLLLVNTEGRVVWVNAALAGVVGLAPAGREPAVADGERTGPNPAKNTGLSVSAGEPGPGPAAGDPSPDLAAAKAGPDVAAVNPGPRPAAAATGLSVSAGDPDATPGGGEARQ